MADWDKRLLAVVVTYVVGLILWFVGFASPDPTPDAPPPVLAPVAAANVAFAGAQHYQALSFSRFSSKLDIGTIFIKSVIHAGTVGVPLMGLISIGITIAACKLEKLQFVGAFSIISGLLAVMFVIAAFFAIAETEATYGRILEGFGLVLCFSALLSSSGVAYLTYKEMKKSNARGYAIYQDDLEDAEALVSH